MLLSLLDRMEIHKRQASLILPFIQQLSRIEEESKFAFLKFEKSHASFKNVGCCAWEEKKRRENVVVMHKYIYIYTLFFLENDAIMN